MKTMHVGLPVKAKLMQQLGKEYLNTYAQMEVLLLCFGIKENKSCLS